MSPTVPLPRTAESSSTTSSSSSGPNPRRLSISVSPNLLSSSPRPIPLPVPQRHGSFSRSGQTGTQSQSHRSRASVSMSIGSPSRSIPTQFGTSLFAASLPTSGGGGGSAGESYMRRQRRPSEHVPGKPKLEESEMEMDDGRWLDIPAEVITTAKACIIPGSTNTEEAVEALIKSNQPCLLITNPTDGTYGFFDYADLNTFLLLVLDASSPSSPSEPGFDPFDSPLSTASATASSTPPLERRNAELVARLRQGKQVVIGSITDISQKDPFHSFPASTPLRTLLPLFASGVHRVMLSPSPSPSPASPSPHSAPRILSASAVLQHLISSPSIPALFNLAITSPQLKLPLHPLISLPGTASVLDAMQVMSYNGLSALGVMSGSSLHRRDSSNSSASSSSSGLHGHGQGKSFPHGATAHSSSPHLATSPHPFHASPLMLPALSPGPLPSPISTSMPSTATGMGDTYGSGSGHGNLASIVTAEACTRLVIPSKGRQVLGMGLQQVMKAVQQLEYAGQDRGEERVPVHSIGGQSTLLHASHLILATSSSRVFLRTMPMTMGMGAAMGMGVSPPLSPAPSVSVSISPDVSPSLSSLSLSDSQSQSHSRPMSSRPSLPPTVLSPHYVISIIDILSTLAKAYRTKLTPPRPSTNQDQDTLAIGPGPGAGSDWTLDPGFMAKKRRESTSLSAPSGGFHSWRWAADDKA